MKTKTFLSVLEGHECTITAEFNPAERHTRDYPGCPAHISYWELEFEDGIERPELLKRMESWIEKNCMEQFEED